jgi:hypothetical protein
MASLTNSNDMKFFGRSLGFILLTAVGGGCGTAPTLLNGQVTYDGAPVAHGYITFFPTVSRGDSRGAPIRDGRYVLDLPPGEYRVLVTAQPKVTVAARPQLLPGVPIPANAPANSSLHAIAAGQTTLNLAIGRRNS